MSRMYTVSFANVAVTAAQDLFEITAAAGKNLRIRGLILAQHSDAKDEEEEIKAILMKSGQTTSGSGGSAGSAVPTNVTTTAAGFSSEVNNTTKASGGTIVTHLADAWNIRVNYIWVPPLDMCVELTGGRRFTVELVSAPTDELTMEGTLFVEEFG